MKMTDLMYLSGNRYKLMRTQLVQRSDCSLQKCRLLILFHNLNAANSKLLESFDASESYSLVGYSFHDLSKDIMIIYDDI